MNKYDNDELSQNGYSENPNYDDSNYENQQYSDYSYGTYEGQPYNNTDYSYGSSNGQPFTSPDFSYVNSGEQQFAGSDFSYMNSDEQQFAGSDFSYMNSDEQQFAGSGFSYENSNGQAFANTDFSYENFSSEQYTSSDFSYENSDMGQLSDEAYSGTETDDQPFTTTAYTRKTSDQQTNTSFSNHVVQYNGSDEDLTPAELEDIKRQKAAARRRRQAAKERRMRELRKQLIIRISILLLIIVLIIVGFVKMISGIVHLVQKNTKEATTTEATTEQATTTEEPVAEIDTSILAIELPADRNAALALLKTQSETNTQIKSVYDNAAVYSDTLLRYLASNNEMCQFVLDYPAKVNTVYDGEFSVTISPAEVPLFLVYDEQWGYADYGDNLLAINGVAPTCLSMTAAYLKQDGSLNPIKVGDFSMANNYIDENSVTKETLMTEGASQLGLSSTELNIDKDDMITALAESKVIICAVTSGDFTKSNSYIVIRDYKEGLFYINDPTSNARSLVGWDYKRLSKQITKMWAFSASTTGTGSIDTGTADTTNTGDSTTDTSNTTDGNNSDNTDTSDTSGNDTGNNDTSTPTAE